MREQSSQIGPLLNETNRKGLLYYLSFLIWPFGVTVDALRHWRQPWAKNVFWLFCIFFGYSFIIATDEEGSADSARYAQYLVEYANSSHNLKTLFRSFYSETSSNVDIVQPLITYLVSRVTNNPHILFAVFALIFGFFHSRNIWYILSKLKNGLNFIVILFLFVFILLNPIWSINGFRMWTAAQIFIYGTLPFLFEGKTKFLFWSFLSVFFHFSFVIPVIALCIYVLARNRINIYFGLFIITSFLKEIDLQAIQSFLSFLPEVFQPRIKGYTNIEYAESVSLTNQALNWYLPLALKAVNWVIYLLVLYIFFLNRNFIKDRKGFLNVFSFAIFFYSIANILSLVPSGGRFINIGSTIMFAFFVIFLNDSPKTSGLETVRIISVPLLMLFSLVMLRAGMDYFGIVTIIGNPVFAALGAESEPLITEIKAFL